MRLKNVYLFLIILFTTSPLFSQIIFQDDFTGKDIDAAKWQYKAAEKCTISQDGAMIFSISGIPPAPQYYLELKKTGGAPPSHSFALTQSAFPTRQDNKVLRLTFDVHLSPYAHFMCGLISDGTYSKSSELPPAIQYGYHGNRLDRAIWFMQGPRLVHSDPAEPMAARLLRLPDQIGRASCRERV